MGMQLYIQPLLEHAGAEQMSGEFPPPHLNAKQAIKYGLAIRNSNTMIASNMGASLMEMMLRQQSLAQSLHAESSLVITNHEILESSVCASLSP